MVNIGLFFNNPDDIVANVKEIKELILSSKQPILELLFRKEGIMDFYFLYVR